MAKKEYEKPEMIVYETELIQQLLNISSEDLEKYDTTESTDDWF